MGLSGDEWKGNEPSDGMAKFGKRARRWFSLAVLCHLWHSRGANGAKLFDDEALVERLAEWFTEEAECYVVWVPTKGYVGKGFTTGEWQLDAFALKRDLPTALQEIRNTSVRELARGIGSLDEWLLADLRGTLPTSGAVGGSVHFTEERRRGLHLRKMRLTEWGPYRECQTCHHRFRMDRRHRAHCQECRAAGKAPLPPIGGETPVREDRDCLDCGESFTPHHWNARVCPSCRQDRKDPTRGRRTSQDQRGAA